jgi:hypothetical protein
VLRYALRKQETAASCDLKRFVRAVVTIAVVTKVTLMREQ